jgi:hypothetical protein
MTRQILFVVGVAFLSALGFGLILGVGWLTLHLVLGDSPSLLISRLYCMRGVLSALFALVAVVGAGWATSVLVSRNSANRSNRDLEPHAKLRG